MAAARRIIFEALAARHGGAAYSTLHIAEGLGREASADEVVVVTRERSLIADAVLRAEGLRVVRLRRPARFELAWRLAWQALMLPSLARRIGATAVVTWSGMLPRRVGAPVICYLANPVVFVADDRGNRIRRWAVRRTARRAHRLVTPSRGMADLVAQAVGRQPDVVPLGIDHESFAPALRPGTEIVCVADVYRHKRHDLLIEAWAALPAPRPTLRLVGDTAVDPRWGERIEQMVREHRGRGTIVLESGLSAQELLEAYQRARVFVLPTELESFCLPLLEALACGVPAVVRDLPALRETGGSAPTYVADEDPRLWAAAVKRLLDDDAEHESARQTGLRQAGGFSWGLTADRFRRLIPG